MRVIAGGPFNYREKKVEFDKEKLVQFVSITTFYTNGIWLNKHGF
jgi:hypothetical protein